MSSQFSLTHVLLPPAALVDAETLRCALCETFDSEFDAWPVDENARIVTSSQELPATLRTHKEQLEPAPAPGSVAVVPLDERQTAVLACTATTELDHILLIGVVPGSDPALIQRLVLSARRIAEQREELEQKELELNACLEQLTYDLEEQTWLRTLSQQVQMCDVRRNSPDVAAELLPALRELVAAESIAFLCEADGWQLGRGFEISSCTHYGRAIVPDSFWSQWLDRHWDDVVPGPQIANARHVDSDLAGFGVRSYIVVRVGGRETKSGWLIALNRLACRPSVMSDPESAPARMSEMEFGTVEAGLLEATASMLATHAQNARILKSRDDLVVGVIRAMSAAIDARDPYTRGHSERVGGLARKIARRLGIEEHDCNRIYLSGLLHDVGKIGIRDRVLLKPEKLNEDDFAEMKRHPEIGHRIVSRLGELEDLLPGILHHHESYDGTGYPHGLAADRIPLMARIIAVADAYDAMTSDRPYRAGKSSDEAVQLLQKLSGVQWDPRVVDAALPVFQIRETQESTDSSDSHIGLNAVVCS